MIYYSFLMVLLSIGVTIFYSAATSTRPLLLLIAICIPVVVLHIGHRARLNIIYRKFFQLRYVYLRIILALFILVAYALLSLNCFHVTTVALFMVISYFILGLLKDFRNQAKGNRLLETMKLVAGGSLLIIASAQMSYGVVWSVALISGSFVANLAIMLLFREIVHLYRQNYILEELIMVTLLPLLIIVAIIAYNHPFVLIGSYAWIELFIDSLIIAGNVVIVPYVLLNYLIIHSQKIKYRLSVFFPLVTIVVANFFEIGSGIESGVVAAFTSLLVVL